MIPNVSEIDFEKLATTILSKMTNFGLSRPTLFDVIYNHLRSIYGVNKGWETQNATQLIMNVMNILISANVLELDHTTNGPTYFPPFGD